MRRRLMVAKAMVHQPPVLVLDEPTAGVDIELRQQLWANVRELNRAGTTVLLTTHYLEEAEELRSEEHTSELQSLMRNSYAVFCLKKKIQKITNQIENTIAKQTHN